MEAFAPLDTIIPLFLNAGKGSSEHFGNVAAGFFTFTFVVTPCSQPPTVSSAERTSCTRSAYRNESSALTGSSGGRRLRPSKRKSSF